MKTITEYLNWVKRPSFIGVVCGENTDARYEIAVIMDGDRDEEITLKRWQLYEILASVRNGTLDEVNNIIVDTYEDRELMFDRREALRLP